jgi:hypothetical protein|tara:strand:- start:1132 stop:1500 length:369 start_codon:yes stop_codon:yes gene_type:complete
MSNKSYLLGDVELHLEEIKQLAQYFESILTYNSQKELVPKKDENGKELKKLKLNFSIFEEGNYGKNVSFTIPQSKEQRENKEKKRYVANGKIYYASDDLQGFVQKSEAKAEVQQEETVDLPF